MTTMADEHPRGILLYSTHWVYNPSFSNFSYFFPQVSKTRAERLFFLPPNKSPHREVNNINTYVSGVRAGALLKLIFQNVFLLLLQLHGRPPSGTSPSRNQSLWGGGSEGGKGIGEMQTRCCEQVHLKARRVHLPPRWWCSFWSSRHLVVLFFPLETITHLWRDTLSLCTYPAPYQNFPLDLAPIGDPCLTNLHYGCCKEGKGFPQFS